MLRFCALVFTSGEALEIVLYKERNNVNILSIAQRIGDLDESSSKETPEIFSKTGD